VTGQKEEIEMDRRRRPLMAACLVFAGLALAGCESVAQAQSSQSGAPAHVQAVPGSDLSQVTLSADAAKRIALRTRPITAAPAGSAIGRSEIPLVAVLYDKDGKTWAYTQVRPLTFVRAAVGIAHIDGETATLDSGPAVGTLVVTVGGAELLGAEYGVPGEQ
jgi:hypothetical protein